MHPEIRQDSPGTCTKCGMRLVLVDRGLGVLTWKNYLPLIVIISSILLSSAILSWMDYTVNHFSLFRFISYFMTGFFIVFAGFKLLDVKGFVEGYSTYDLLAQKVFAYGYVYPFIELGFGLFMLAGIHSTWLLLSEIVIMTFSGAGVIRKLLRKEPVQCVCLGTLLKIPLTNITLVEDFGMAALALVLLIHGT